MNTDRLERLAHDELDGTATTSQIAELKAMLAQSEEARIRYEEIRQVFQFLGDQRPLEPPSSLKTSVLAAVREQAAPAPRIGALGRVKPLGYVCAFAAGALVVLALTSGAHFAGARGDAAISGAMTPVRGRALDRQTVEWSGGSAECATWRSGDRVTAILTIRGGQWTEMDLAFDPALVSVVQARPPRTARIWMAPGRVRLAGRDGECALELMTPGGAPATVAMVVRSAGNVLPSRTVKLF
jgi:hypothetical protein